jgi:hypothetical protein
MPADWDVDKALNETLDAMEAGAGLLKIGPDLRTALRNLYYPDFYTQHQNNVEWYGDNELKVVTVATMGGMMASVMTVARTPNPFPIPKEVDKDSAFQAAYWMANSIYCPLRGLSRLKIFGGFCAHARDLKGISRDPHVLLKLAKVFAKPLRELTERDER